MKKETYTYSTRKGEQDDFTKEDGQPIVYTTVTRTKIVNKYIKNEVRITKILLSVESFFCVCFTWPKRRASGSNPPKPEEKLSMSKQEYICTAGRAQTGARGTSWRGTVGTKKSEYVQHT